MTKRAKHVALSCRTRPNTAVWKKRGYYKGTARRHLKSLISKPKKLVLDFKIGDVARFHRFGRGGEGVRETLESVSSCTQFSGFLAISSFGFNRLSSKLVSMFFGIVPMFVLKDFVRDCFIAQICANSGAHAHFGAYLRDEAITKKIL